MPSSNRNPARSSVNGPVLRSSRNSWALPPGGLLVIHGAFINAEKTGPLHVAEYSALLMQITEGKCYSLGEMRRYLAETGFDWRAHQDTAAARDFILAERLS